MVKKDLLLIFGIAILSGLLVSASFSFGLFSGLENFFEDLFFLPKPVHKDIVIVAIDNDSLERIGQWPWPREVFGRILLALEKDSPAALGMDVIFPDRSRLGENDDLFFKEALDKISYPVVLPVEASPLILEENSARAGIFIKPLKMFEEAKSVTLGQVNLILDRDGIVRKFPLAVPPHQAFAYEVFRRSGKRGPENSLLDINRIVFSAPSGSIRRIPFWRILEEEAAEILKDKIVLIGVTAPDLHDEKPTPLSRGTEMAGVEIQANILNMLLSGYRLVPLSKEITFLWIFLASLFSTFPFLIFRGSLKPILLNGGLGALSLAGIILLFDQGIAANFLHLNFAWLLTTSSLFSYRYFISEKEKQELKRIFSKYVSKEVLAEILRNPNKVKLGGEEREVTVFFSDIRGFTAFSEKISPKELVSILNKYFTLMTEEVLKNGGVLDKYIGDSIMAFWGAPFEDSAQAENALKASLGMLEKLKELNKELKSRGEPEINIGIGIYTGPAVVGNVGSELRFDYTVMGDTVNVASRLEGLNKEYKTQIIIGETTKNKIKGNYQFKFLGSAAVKGRKEPLNIYTKNG